MNECELNCMKGCELLQMLNDGRLLSICQQSYERTVKGTDKPLRIKMLWLLTPSNTEPIKALVKLRFGNECITSCQVFGNQRDAIVDSLYGVSKHVIAALQQGGVAVYDRKQYVTRMTQNLISGLPGDITDRIRRHEKMMLNEFGPGDSPGPSPFIIDTIAFFSVYFILDSYIFSHDTTAFRSSSS